MIKQWCMCLRPAYAHDFLSCWPGLIMPPSLHWPFDLINRPLCRLYIVSPGNQSGNSITSEISMVNNSSKKLQHLRHMHSKYRKTERSYWRPLTRLYSCPIGPVAYFKMIKAYHSKWTSLMSELQKRCDWTAIGWTSCFKHGSHKIAVKQFLYFEILEKLTTW
jgi:hypothetical protein